MRERQIHGEGTYAHYVTFSCYKRRKVLDSDRCKQVVIGCLAAQLNRQSGICVGFVLMTDHVHALLWFPEENQISLFMNKWKDVSSVMIADACATQFPRYWQKLPAGDPIWQTRYYDFNVFSAAKLREKLTYMHNNPVRAGLVKEAEAWPWSSARFWTLGKSVGVPLSFPP
jgi:putative transposase